MDEKNMHFANFNITFGDNDSPMLEHFEDIIFPAFTSGLIRGKKDVLPYFSFDDVRIKEINGEYAVSRTICVSLKELTGCEMHRCGSCVQSEKMAV